MALLKTKRGILHIVRILSVKVSNSVHGTVDMLWYNNVSFASINTPRISYVAAVLAHHIQTWKKYNIKSNSLSLFTS